MRIIGLNEVTNAFQKAAATVEPRSAKATRKVADALAQDARSFAPTLSGALRDSIEVTQQGTTAEVGPTVRYGGFVEYGTSDTAPQPFMQPAADRQAPELAKAIEDIGADL